MKVESQKLAGYAGDMYLWPACDGRRDFEWPKHH